MLKFLIVAMCLFVMPMPQGVGVTVIQAPDSTGFIVDWPDPQGRPVAYSNVRIIEGADTIAASVVTVTIDTLWVAGPVPGDSLTVFAAVNSVDKKGEESAWTLSDPMTVLGPQLPLLPPASVTLDTAQADPPVDPPVDPDPPIDPPSGALWSTTFDAAEGVEYGDPGLPDNLIWAGTGGTGPTVITSAANRLGGGGRGARHYSGNGRNVTSGKMGLSFASVGASQQPEFWVRWYVRYDPTFSWGGSNPIWDKMLYLFTPSGGPQHYVEWGGSHIRIGTPSGDIDSDIPGFSWAEIIGAAAGDWVCIELYIKMDTNGSDGIARMWFDGVLGMEHTDANFSGGNATARNGWSIFTFHNNQGNPVDAPSIGYTVDYDDMAIYNTTPPNVDSRSNAMIGPIS